jgi:TRAP-type mannitol/chloroaromatic compound transport system permease small subunit
MVNEWLGRKVSLLVFPLIAFTFFEVVARYVFNRPTVWVADINVQLSGLIVTLGAGYTLLLGGHVVVDIVVARFSPRTRAILDLITAMLFFFWMGILAWHAGKASLHSLLQKEAYTSVLEPPIYPLKILMTGGICLMLLQGVVKFINDLGSVIGGKWKR